MTDEVTQTHRMWAACNKNGYMVVVRHSRSECIAEMEAFWGMRWRQIKHRYGVYLTRVVVTPEA